MRKQTAHARCSVACAVRDGVLRQTMAMSTMKKQSTSISTQKPVDPGAAGESKPSRNGTTSAT